MDRGAKAAGIASVEWRWGTDADADADAYARSASWWEAQTTDFEGYVRGLADLYVHDERFAANYGGRAGAEFVRASLLAHLDAG